ncbi:MAG: hypothetical protein ABFC57_17660 [Veillonellales bacterium]
MGISKLLFDKNVYKIVGEKAGNSMENCRGWGVAIGDGLLAFGTQLIVRGTRNEKIALGTKFCHY